MMRFGSKSLVVSSLLLLSVMAGAGTRPQYGGTIRITLRIAPNSLDPLDSTQPDSIARRNLSRMLFDTLVTIDDFGRIKPALAVSWDSDAGHQKWQFLIRSGVKFDDGSSLTPTVVAAALRSANPAWNVYGNGDSVSIALPAPDPMLLANLSQARNSIVRRTPAGLSGTGPFHASDWQPGKRLVAAANEEYWDGRPFLDSVQVEFGTAYHDQQVALDLNKADVIEIVPEQAKRAGMEGRRVVSSAPFELMAILFTRDRQSPEDGKLRRALALSFDRASIRNVLLQGTGDPAGGILPNWMTGYEFLFPTDGNMEKAREQRIEVAQAPVWVIGYDAGDPLSRLVAERVALNARDAGIPAQTSVLNVDLKVIRVQTPSLNPQAAFAGLCATLGLATPRFANGSVAALYDAENTILENQRIIPLIHLPVSYAISSRVKNWGLGRDGTWGLANTWLATEKP
jgi:peptide/nickel transport system substrate-binding protein